MKKNFSFSDLKSAFDLRDSKYRELTETIGTSGGIFPHQDNRTGYKVLFTMKSPVCPECKSSLITKSTNNKRTFYSLRYGKVNAVYTVYHCVNKDCIFCKTAASIRATELDELVLPGQKYGFDIIYLIGQLRCSASKQRCEVKEMLAKIGIYISEGSITNLANMFANNLCEIQEYNAPAIRKMLEETGGHSYGVDCTTEGGKGTTLVIRDSERGLLLKSLGLDTENRKDIFTNLKHTKKLYGTPFSCMSDCGSPVMAAIKDFIEEIKQDPASIIIPKQFVCQYHLIDDVGGDMYKSSYEKLHTEIEESKIRTKMRYVIQVFKSSGLDAKEAEKLINKIDTVKVDNDSAEFQKLKSNKNLELGLAFYIRDYNEKSQNHFPFKVPYYVFHQRCLKAIDIINLLLNEKNLSKEQKENFERVKTVIDGYLNREKLKSTIEPFEKCHKLFQDLRKVLRYESSFFEEIDSRKAESKTERRWLTEQQAEQIGKAIEKVKAAVERFIELLKAKLVTETDKDVRIAMKHIITHYDDYKDYIFDHIIETNITKPQKL